jgi:hypothetical protein
MMSDSHSDALIFFGVTGDLAHKKIFPSLQAMLKCGHLEVPVIRVAKSGWNLDQFRARARDSLEKHGGLLHCHSAGSGWSWNSSASRAVPKVPGSSSAVGDRPRFSAGAQPNPVRHIQRGGDFPHRSLPREAAGA